MKLSWVQLLSFSVITTANYLKIHEIFDISQTPGQGSCGSIYSQNNDEAVLNIWWDQVADMVMAGAQSSEPDEYAQDFEIRKSLYTWFSIQPNADGSLPLYDPASHEASSRFLQIRTALSSVWWLMTHAVKDVSKPKLFCSSDFLQYQTGDMCALDNTGRRIMKRNSQECYKLEEYETLTGNRQLWEDNYYFHYDVSAQYPDPGVVGDHKYLLFPKGDDVWIKNENRADICHHPGMYGVTTLVLTDRGVPKNLAPVMLLCLNNEPQRALDNFNADEVQPDDETVKADDALEIRAMTFFHELFHLALPQGTTFDQPYYRCKARDRRNRPVTAGLAPNFFKWPDHPSSWEERDEAANGALETLQLGLWERTAGKAGNGGRIRSESLTNPDSLAWWCLINYTRWRTGQDWSTGFCRKAGSQAQNPPPTRFTNGTQTIELNAETSPDADDVERAARMVIWEKR